MRRKAKRYCTAKKISCVELYEGILWNHQSGYWNNKENLSIKEIKEFFSLITEEAISYYTKFHPVKEDFEKVERL